ncbi:MAG TPA: transposase [Candidatus Udaeobacter sp.]
MSSTHLSLHYHIVFGTKNHEPLIQPSWRGNLHAYLGGIIRTAGGVAESVGGVSDHVHLLIGLRATHRLADVLRELKAVSSRWVHDEIGLRAFAWQEGYGAFTVSASQREASVITSSNKRSIIARAHFAKSIWNCYGAVAWNLKNAIFNPTPLPGLVVVLYPRKPVVLCHRLIS